MSLIIDTLKFIVEPYRISYGKVLPFLLSAIFKILARISEFFHNIFQELSNYLIKLSEFGFSKEDVWALLGIVFFGYIAIMFLIVFIKIGEILIKGVEEFYEKNGEKGVGFIILIWLFGFPLVVYGCYFIMPFQFGKLIQFIITIIVGIIAINLYSKFTGYEHVDDN